VEGTLTGSRRADGKKKKGKMGKGGRWGARVKGKRKDGRSWSLIGDGKRVFQGNGECQLGLGLLSGEGAVEKTETLCMQG